MISHLEALALTYRTASELFWAGNRDERDEWREVNHVRFTDIERTSSELLAFVVAEWDPAV